MKIFNVLFFLIFFCEIGFAQIPIHLIRVEDSTQVGQLIAVLPDSDGLDTVFKYIDFRYINDSTLILGTNDTIITSANAESFDLGGVSSWNDLTDIPAPFADGVDDVNGGNATLLNSQLASYYLDWNNATNIPAGFADDVDDVDDSDANPTNEIQTVSYTPGTRTIGLSSSNSVALSNLFSTDNDGSGSLLDADLLDGQEGSYYLNYNNLTNTIWQKNGTSVYYNNGNIGIGTNTPNRQLTLDLSNIAPYNTKGIDLIQGTGYIKLGSETSISSNFLPALRMKPNYAAPTVIQGFQHSDNQIFEVFRYMVGNSTENGPISSTKTAYVFQNYTTPLFKVMGSGNFGIGNITPSEKLHVSGAAKIENKLMLGTASYNVFLDSPSTGTFELYTNNTERIDIDATGRTYLPGRMALGFSGSVSSKLHILQNSDDHALSVAMLSNKTRGSYFSEGTIDYMVANTTTSDRELLLGEEGASEASSVDVVVNYNLETNNEILKSISGSENTYGGVLATSGTYQIERENAAFVRCDYAGQTTIHIELDAALNGTVQENYIKLMGKWGGFAIDARFLVTFTSSTVTIADLGNSELPPFFTFSGYVSSNSKPALKLTISGGNLEDTIFPIHIMRGMTQNGTAEACPPISQIVFNTGTNI